MNDDEPVAGGFRAHPGTPATRRWTPEEMRAARPMPTPEPPPAQPRDLRQRALLEVLDRLAESGSVTLEDVATAFNLDQSVVRSSLAEARQLIATWHLRP
ncbi:hypothetical protein [Herbihabitans rhizosphaerae]|uniref:hypothetical protein n=1 Tax=Herbihabitans rhizosphaerae TaxID=1872711 RepID=UPI00102AC973|nr:hypothetical protein [Herbihabitans rhizosphaerae]